MQLEIVGWDIGGAHLKAAALNTDQTIERVWQQACPLWQGMQMLTQAFQSILQELPALPRWHVLTMTGELVDLFPGRAEGVRAIVAAAVEILTAEKVRIFAGKLGFIKPEYLHDRLIDDVASANWYASAAYAAAKVGNGLFIDIGSTTTDILLLADAAVQPLGTTDFARLGSGELVYTGIVRTPVMAISEQVVFQGQSVGLMAEYFAAMADVYRLTGELNAEHDQHATADGAPKTLAASARRLARMIGCDFREPELPLWIDLARSLRLLQLQKIRAASERQLSRVTQPANTVVGAGIGRFLVKDLARQLNCSYLDFDALCPSLTASAMTCADCAPAAAVALLAVKAESVC